MASKIGMVIMLMAIANLTVSGVALGTGLFFFIGAVLYLAF